MSVSAKQAHSRPPSAKSLEKRRPTTAGASHKERSTCARAQRNHLRRADRRQRDRSGRQMRKIELKQQYRASINAGRRYDARWCTDRRSQAISQSMDAPQSNFLYITPLRPPYTCGPDNTSNCARFVMKMRFLRPSLGGGRRRACLLQFLSSWPSWRCCR
jgi:hypothetical protein